MGASSAEISAPARAETATARPRARARWRRLLPWAAGVLVLLACLGLQTQLYTGQERTVTTIFMFVALAQAWNIIGGFAGYASFGQVVFFGIGGYSTAVFAGFAAGGLSWVWRRGLPPVRRAILSSAPLDGVPMRAELSPCLTWSP